MRRLVLLGLIALAALLALRHRRARPAAPLAPVAPAGELPSPPAPGLAPTPAPEEAAPLFLSVPWTLLDAPADAPELTIRPALPPHMALDRCDVQETPTQVFVTVIARPRTPDDEDAPERTPVPLSRPLGEREPVHAPVDEDDTAPGPRHYA